MWNRIESNDQCLQPFWCRLFPDQQESFHLCSLGIVRDCVQLLFTDMFEAGYWIKMILFSFILKPVNRCIKILKKNYVSKSHKSLLGMLNESLRLLLIDIVRLISVIGCNWDGFKRSFVITISTSFESPANSIRTCCPCRIWIKKWSQIIQFFQSFTSESFSTGSFVTLAGLKWMINLSQYDSPGKVGTSYPGATLLESPDTNAWNVLERVILWEWC